MRFLTGVQQPVSWSPGFRWYGVHYGSGQGGQVFARSKESSSQLISRGGPLDWSRPDGQRRREAAAATVAAKLQLRLKESRKVCGMAVKKGTTLMTAEPFVQVLKSNLQGQRCDNCFRRKENLRRCSGCKFTFYCNQDCQRNAWADHREECANLKRVAPKTPPDTLRLMAKIILKLRRGGDKEEGKISENRSRKFKDLMSHYSDIKKDAKRMEHFATLCHVLTEFIGEDKLPNPAELIGIFGRICVNSFNILDSEMQPIGTGIYLAPSIIDHSCEPNALAVFEGTTIHIRALEDFPVLDWSKVFISYIDLMNVTSERRKELQERYYFECNCLRCKDSSLDAMMNSVVCENSDCQAIVEVKVECPELQIGPCPTCNHHFKPEVAREYAEVTQFTREQLLNMRDVAYLDVCKVCLQRQGSLFHPLNILRAKILDSAFDSSIGLQLWEEALAFGLQTLPAYRKYYGPCHPLLGIQLLKLGKIELYLNSLEEAYQHLSQAAEILRITHGTSHSLYVSELVVLLQQTQADLMAGGS